MNLLTAPGIRTTRTAGSVKCLTLPGVLAALARDLIESFPALRAHQRHAWHSFLVQIAALALSNAGRTDLPEDEASWTALLRGLTPDVPDDAPWSLLAPPDRPALLQPPVPSLAELKTRVSTPDALDMLVTSKNHDLKAEAMIDTEPDDWLFALITLQTMQGYYGKNNYGISRLFKSHGNRPAVGIAPAESAMCDGSPGRHFRRDVTQLPVLRPKILQAGYVSFGGLGLVWLKPWDGKHSMRVTELDPFYVEICRRVRLIEVGGRLQARAGGSTVPRITPIDGALTGDPWAPRSVTKSGDQHVLTLTADNGENAFAYGRMVQLMFGSGRYIPSDLQKIAETDTDTGITILARALVRGEGKTEGYHERRVPLSRRVGARMTSRDAEPIARAAQDRVAIAGEIQNRVLKSALLALFENGPDKIDYRDGATRRAGAFLARFDRHVDRDFFSELWKEFETDADWRDIRKAWVGGLLAIARDLVADADRSASKAVKRRYKARARADAKLSGAPHRTPVLQPWLPETPR